jgi:hypothetical protein
MVIVMMVSVMPLKSRCDDPNPAVVMAWVQRCGYWGFCFHFEGGSVSPHEILCVCMGIVMVQVRMV